MLPCTCRLEFELLIVWAGAAGWSAMEAVAAYCWLCKEARADCRFGVLGKAVDVLMALPGSRWLFMLVSRDGPWKLEKFWRL